MMTIVDDGDDDDEDEADADAISISFYLFPGRNQTEPNFVSKDAAKQSLLGGFCWGLSSFAILKQCQKVATSTSSSWHRGLLRFKVPIIIAASLTGTQVG